MVSSRSISTGLPPTFFFSIFGTTRPPFRSMSLRRSSGSSGSGQLRDKRCAARRDWPVRRPYVQGRDMPMPNILLVDRIQRGLLQRKPPLYQSRQVIHSAPAPNAVACSLPASPCRGEVARHLFAARVRDRQIKDV